LKFPFFRLHAFFLAPVEQYNAGRRQIPSASSQLATSFSFSSSQTICRAKLHKHTGMAFFISIRSLIMARPDSNRQVASTTSGFVRTDNNTSFDAVTNGPNWDSSRWAEAVASGAVGFPNNIGCEEAEQLSLEVSRRRRDRLVKYIARMIAQDILATSIKKHKLDQS
jgi:hypothetical protein